MGQECSHSVEQVQQVIEQTLYQPSAEQVKIQIELLRRKNYHLINIAQKYSFPQKKQQYFGYIQNQLKQGYGELKASEDKRYYGYFKDNLPHFKGVLIFSNDHYYIGQFQNGKMQGMGKEVSPYFTFEGQYLNDRKKYGKLQTEEFVYQGSFQQFMNNFGGFGQLKYKNGQKYIGNFKQGKFYGQGVFFDENNRLIYEGQFKNSLYDGIGKYYWQDGSYYEGNYAGGLKDGQGKYVKEGAEPVYGIWTKGLITSKTKSKSISQKSSRYEKINNNSSHSTKMQEIY